MLTHDTNFSQPLAEQGHVVNTVYSRRMRHVLIDRIRDSLTPHVQHLNSGVEQLYRSVVDEPVLLFCLTDSYSFCSHLLYYFEQTELADSWVSRL